MLDLLVQTVCTGMYVCMKYVRSFTWVEWQSTHPCDRWSVQVISLQKQVLLLKKKLKNSMEQYCRSLVSQGVPEDTAEELAMKAQLKLHDDPLRKRIYKDFQELSAKQSDLDTCRSDSNSHLPSEWSNIECIINCWMINKSKTTTHLSGSGSHLWLVTL